MAEQKARRCQLLLTYNGKPIPTTDLSPHVVGFDYTDQAGDEADELSVTVDDRDGRWRGPWRPQEGASLDAALVVTDWFEPGDRHKAKLGKFWIDALETDASPDTVIFRATSVPIGQAIRRERRTRAWANTNTRQIASDIASTHGLGLDYQGASFPVDREDQRDRSDMSFLVRLCRDHGLRVKVFDGKLIVYEGQLLESRAPQLTLTRGQSLISRCRIKGQLYTAYRGCRVTYHDPVSGRDQAYTFLPEGAPASGHLLTVNRRVKSLKWAERLARARLRRANKGEVSGRLTLLGDPRLRAGLVLNIKGFGWDDVVFTIEEAAHLDDAEQGYLTRLRVERTLGY